MARTKPILHQNNLLFTFQSKTSPSPSLFFFNPRSTSSLHFSHSLSSSPPCRVVTRVTTVPIEFSPPTPEFDLHREVTRLQAINRRLMECNSLREKFEVIDSDSRVRRFFYSRRNAVSRVLDSVGLDAYQLFLLKCLVAAGQEHVLLCSGGVEFERSTARGSLKSALYALADIIENWDVNGGGFGKKSFVNGDLQLKDEEVASLKQLLKTLEEVEKFYNCIGGIVGYQSKVLELLTESTFQRRSVDMPQHINEAMDCQFLEIHSPSGLDLSHNTEYASETALWGIQGLPDLGEIYPLGGSADRLGLVNPGTGECLPAAMLPYCGRTLLEGLIRDLQAREFLYFKIYGKQCVTPVAIMTSSAKNNHDHITSLCEKLGWFGRGKSNFKLFEQPLVPTVSAEDGQWLVTKPFKPVCKPGGHGVIWKLAYDKGVFQWFYDHGRKGATVRQVSNVVASTDCTLLALAGIGLRHGKKLGFASCKRNLGATEGINVLIEKKNFDGKWAYGLSCIEYTEFKKFGITDGLGAPNNFQADFPANTNILYVDLPSAELVGSTTDENSLPGMVLNIKKPIEYVDQFGNRHSVFGGRLECTMQNIADNFMNTYASRCYKGVEDEMDTYIVYNERKRVTSSAKKKRRNLDRTFHQTPDGSLLDIMRNAYDLLTQSQINIPEIEGNNAYVESGPPFLIFLHPALGPLWEVMRQKFHGGSISKGSELEIGVAEFVWRDVQLDGSMIILAKNVFGSTKTDENGERMLQYGQRCGRCKLQNVRVHNEGIDWNADTNVYWKHDVQRFEALRVVLHGNAEFEATDVTLQGNHVYEVPDGYRMKITPGSTDLSVTLNRIESRMIDCGSWFWEYKLKGTHIELEMVEL